MTRLLVFVFEGVAKLFNGGGNSLDEFGEFFATKEDEDDDGDNDNFCGSDSRHLG